MSEDRLLKLFGYWLLAMMLVMAILAIANLVWYIISGDQLLPE